MTLALSGGYLDLFEEQGFQPEPRASRRDADTLYLTFDAPATGDTFVVAYDAYVQPSPNKDGPPPSRCSPTGARWRPSRSGPG